MIKVRLFQRDAGLSCRTNAARQLQQLQQQQYRQTVLMCCTVRPQIWSMKKTEDAAAKRKPKTSAAQIRVQKGQ